MCKSFRVTLMVFGIGVFCLLGFLNVPAQTKSKFFDVRNLKEYKLQSLLLSPSADLDQCANGGFGSPPVVCSGTAWQNGNLGQGQAHYFEGDSVPYRLKFSGLSVGSSYNVTIEYDTTENSGAKHALDYLTSFDRTETTADPCSSVAGCSLAVKDTFAIPIDSNVTAGFDGVPGNGNDITQVPGVFTLFSGDITAVSGYTVNGTYAGISQTRITITFTADAENPVLAWGGHISRRIDWGITRSAIAINGSPYHMRLIDFDGSGGNQDRGLSSAATIFPAKLTIVLDARPDTSQVFGFTVSGPEVTGFSLVDDGTNTNNSITFNLTNFGSGTDRTLTENLPGGGYSLTQIFCVEDASGGVGIQNTTFNVSTRTANAVIEEGESVTCTFVNAVPTAATAVVSGRISNAYGGYVSGVSVLVTNLSTGETRSTRTNTFGVYQFTELAVGNNYLIAVSSRRYQFAVDSRIVTLMDDLTEQDFTAIPIN
jgi:hypothetical protein